MEIAIIVTVIIFTLGSIVSAGWVFQRKLMYYPEFVPAAEALVGPDDGAEEVSFTAEDGIGLSAIYTAAPEGGMTVLLLHGNAGSLRSWKYLHFEIAALGTGVLTVDYRGFGKSGGRPHEAGLYADGRAAVEFLKSKGVRSEDLVLFGKSLGTGVAVQLAVDSPCAGVILESPYSSFAAVVRRMMPGLPAQALLRDNYDSLSKISGLTVPLLVVVGDRDTLIVPEDSLRLFDAAPKPKSWYEVKGAGHNDIQHLGGSPYFEQLRAWILARSEKI